MNRFSNIKNHLFNILGWKTKQKIVVIESDDWGSIRTSSKKALNILRKSGMRVDDCHYMMNDGLASEEDLSILLETLHKYQDKNGSKPVITANCLVANPDFDKIEESGFQQYFREDFKTTLNRYPRHQNSFAIWEQGIREKVFHPQSHGMEHLHLQRWMTALQAGDPETHLAFKLQMFGVSGHVVKIKRNSYLAALDGVEGKEKDDRQTIVSDGLVNFEKIFGFKSKSFIAPNYVWDETIEESTAKSGVRFLQGSTVQQVSSKESQPNKKVRHYLGQRNKYGQCYLVRNVHFEPSSQPGRDWVNTCLKEIEIAFLWRKPAIISTHRVNFVGFINPDNRDSNLKLFENLLKNIIHRWPNVEFMTSDQLGDLTTQRYLNR